MKILVGDIGSTSSDWAAIGPTSIDVYSSLGFNPSAHEDGQFSAMLNQMPEEFPLEFDAIFYYGAGVNHNSTRERVFDLLKSTWKATNIEVESDILGAAHAVSGSKPAVVAILGTGSNSCVYDGENIIESAINMGYLLGDEGSGFDIGKRLLKSYFYDLLSEEVVNSLRSKLPASPGEFVRVLYSHKTPNSYIASFAKYAIELRANEEIKGMVTAALQHFTNLHLKKYESSHKIHFVGSIGFYFCDQLRAVLEDAGLELGQVIQKPIQQLAEYHQEQI